MSKNIAIELDGFEDFVRIVWQGPAAKFVDRQGELIILEARPNIRRVKTRYSNWAPNGAFLAFPYMQFFIHDNRTYNTVPGSGTIHNNGLLHVSFTNSPLSEDFLNDDIWFPPIPNVYDNHGVCIAVDNTNIESRGDRTIEEFARDIVQLWWSSPFYDSGGWPSYILIRDTSLRSHERWVNLTKEMIEADDLKPITEVNWPNKIKVEKILNGLKGLRVNEEVPEIPKPSCKCPACMTAWKAKVKALEAAKKAAEVKTAKKAPIPPAAPVLKKANKAEKKVTAKELKKAIQKTVQGKKELQEKIAKMLRENIGGIFKEERPETKPKKKMTRR